MGKIVPFASSISRDPLRGRYHPPVAPSLSQKIARDCTISTHAREVLVCWFKIAEKHGISLSSRARARRVALLRSEMAPHQAKRCIGQVFSRAFAWVNTR